VVDVGGDGKEGILDIEIKKVVTRDRKNDDRSRK
jgi:hypothetical protein